MRCLFKISVFILLKVHKSSAYSAQTKIFEGIDDHFAQKSLPGFGATLSNPGCIPTPLDMYHKLKTTLCGTLLAANRLLHSAPLPRPGTTRYDMG